MSTIETNAPPATPCIVYAAKSTQDRRASIPTQLEECRELAAEHGWVVVSEHVDEGFSAYSGNRGPGLAGAREAAARAAREYGTTAMLIAQAHDRFARGAGDKPGAPESLGEIWHNMRRQDVHLRTVEDDVELRDEASVAAIGRRAHIDSARKSKNVRKGKRRRFERGDTLGGPVHDGYMLGPPKASAIAASGIEYDRVLDPERAPVIRRLFEVLEEQGGRPGPSAREMNLERYRRADGEPWTTRRVRETRNEMFYAGFIQGYGEWRQGSHEALITLERWQAIQEMTQRMDPAAVQARKGGKPGSDEYLLRGLVFCADCQKAMYTRTYAWGRAYVCSAVLGANGTCTALKVPALDAETFVLEHIDEIIGERLLTWLYALADQHEAERGVLDNVVERERERLTQLQRQEERATAHYRRVLGMDDDTLADVALAALGEIKREVEEQAHAVQASESVAAESKAEPDDQAAWQYMMELIEMVRGQVRDATGAAAINAALRGALAAIVVRCDDAGELHIDIRLKDNGGGFSRAYARAQAALWLEAMAAPAEYMTKHLPSTSQTERNTLVYGPVWPGLPLPPLTVALSTPVRPLRRSPARKAACRAPVQRESHTQGAK